MARQRSAARKHHTPGHIGRATPKLAVDEIGDAAEKQPDGAGRAGEVAERQDRDAAPPREQHDRQHAADKAAVERHAALPQLHGFERMLDEMRRVVEQHVAGPAAEDDAERHPEHEIVEVGERQRRGPAPQALVADQRARIEPAEQDADDIGQRIPADLERTDRDQHRIEVGKLQEQERALMDRQGLRAVMRPGVRRSQVRQSGTARLNNAAILLLRLRRAIAIVCAVNSSTAARRRR